MDLKLSRFSASVCVLKGFHIADEVYLAFYTAILSALLIVINIHLAY